LSKTPSRENYSCAVRRWPAIQRRPHGWDLYVLNSERPAKYAEAATCFRRPPRDKVGARAFGSLFLSGAGEAQDNDEVARWLRVSAAAGDQNSQTDLANLVPEGGWCCGGPAKGFRLVRAYAMSGDLVAAFNLGSAWSKGWGRERRTTSSVMAAPRHPRIAGCPINICTVACWVVAPHPTCIERARGLKGQRVPLCLTLRLQWRRC
jgi:TPR repeat protein